MDGLLSWRRGFKVDVGQVFGTGNCAVLLTSEKGTFSSIVRLSKELRQNPVW